MYDLNNCAICGNSATALAINKSDQSIIVPLCDECDDLRPYDKEKFDIYKKRKSINIDDLNAVGVDFDGTLVPNKFPEIGEPEDKHLRVRRFLRYLKSKGKDIVLWTCREDRPERAYLTEAVNYCKKENIPIDFVNEYLAPGMNGYKSKKIWVPLIIDDRVVNVDDLEWEEK